MLRYLPGDADIHCTSRTADGVDLRDADACVALIARTKPDILIHCAWTTAHGTFWHDPENSLWLAAGKALFDAFVRHGGSRIVACGTCAEYAGDSDVPRREDEAIDPARIAFPYARAKFALLEHLRDLGVSYAWPRIFLAYGEGEDRRRLVPSVARAVIAGELARCSSGVQVRDFCDVRDLGAAIARLASSDVEGVINIGHGRPASIGHIAARLGSIAGRPDLIRLGALPDREGEPRLLVPDLTRQTRELGFTPRIALDRGLADAMDYWRHDRLAKN